MRVDPDLRLTKGIVFEIGGVVEGIPDETGAMNVVAVVAPGMGLGIAPKPADWTTGGV
jgi:hypothetical protein